MRLLLVAADPAWWRQVRENDHLRAHIGVLLTELERERDRLLRLVRRDLLERPLAQERVRAPADLLGPELRPGHAACTAANSGRSAAAPREA